MRIKTEYLFFLIFSSSLLFSCASNQSIDDSRNEKLSRERIMNSYPKDISNPNINISSFNGDLLITGQVPRQDLVGLATGEVNTLRNVRQVFNYLQVMGATSFLSRANDRLITNRIKSKLQDSKSLNMTKIRVVTEYGVVYFLGILKKDDLEMLLELTKEIKGVQRVISLVRLEK